MYKRQDKGSLIRSVLEGVIFSLKDNLQILEGVLGEVDTIIASGGGAQSNLWLQIQSDIFNKNIVRSEMSEQAALGAAITAAVGCGCYSSISEAAKTLVKYSDDVIKPIKANVPLYQEIYAVYSRLYETNKDSMHMLRKVNF